MTNDTYSDCLLDIDMGIPGWIRYQEIVNICNYIAYNGYTDILKVGPFAGRLTSAICKSMPNVNVTAIDIFDDISHCDDISRLPEFTFGNFRSKTAMTCSDTYANDHQTKDFFEKLHNYKNVHTIAMDVFNYHTKHQLVIIQMGLHDAFDFDWHDIFDHCMSLSTSATIGAFSILGGYEESPGRKTLVDFYNFNTINHGEFAIYELISKKQL